MSDVGSKHQLKPRQGSIGGKASKQSMKADRMTESFHLGATLNAQGGGGAGATDGLAGAAGGLVANQTLQQKADASLILNAPNVGEYQPSKASTKEKMQLSGRKAGDGSPPERSIVFGRHQAAK